MRCDVPGSEGQPKMAINTPITRKSCRSMTFQCPHWPPDWPSIKAAALAAIQSGEWGRYHSDLTKTLEKRLSSYLDSGPTRLCCSGTAALELALRGCKISNGDEVIMAAYDFPGNFRTVELLGAKPVLADVATPISLNPHSSNPRDISPTICPQQLDAAASPNVRAVIASHLHGSHAEMKRLRQTCDQNGWTLIEDACQAIGGRINGQASGSLGHLATLSFGGSKLVSAGSGGAIIANDQRLAARLSGLLDRPGDTFPLGPLQAAVIDPQLDRLDELTQTRSLTARFLREQVFPEMSDWELLHSPKTDTSTAVTKTENAETRVDRNPRQTGQPTYPLSTSNVPAFYKFCWLAPSREIRQQIIEHGTKRGLPLGEGFRSMSRCSSKRCRKPVPTPQSDILGERLVVMDQRALLITPQQYPELADALHGLHHTVSC
jgi:dTDP-4-amino-4,6-dideoxygalactose transaminase